MTQRDNKNKKVDLHDHLEKGEKDLNIKRELREKLGNLKD